MKIANFCGRPGKHNERLGLLAVVLIIWCLKLVYRPLRMIFKYFFKSRYVLMYKSKKGGGEINTLNHSSLTDLSQEEPVAKSVF